MTIRIKKSNLLKILVIAFIVRLCALGMVYFSGDWSEAFLGPNINVDDWRYEEGGEYYANNANSVVDTETFRTAYYLLGDWTGNHIDKPITQATLWYWIVCIVMYFTKTKWSIRFLNIFLSVLSIIYVYKFTELVYGKKTAVRASYLLALLPYPVLFSCFGYKEQLVMLCTFYLLYKAVGYRYTQRIKISDIIKMVLMALVLMMIRSGASAIWIVLCFVIMFVKKSLNKKINPKVLIATFLALILGGVIMLKLWGVILYKMNYYLFAHENIADASISILTISGIKDIYKLPFAYVFSIIMPISMFGQLTSWASIINNLNICMVPISVGATLYILKKKPDRTVFWCCLLYYCVYVITSINIFRQYAALIPFSLIAYCDFINKASKKEKFIFGIGSIMFATLLVFYYLRRI